MSDLGSQMSDLGSGVPDVRYWSDLALYMGLEPVINVRIQGSPGLGLKNVCFPRVINQCVKLNPHLAMVN